ncbi:MAG: hypothetical protein LUD72_14130 [Bacteroidales bacterium]|nr:hypothetical protein [Bacteroidales bacterium]
MERRDKKYKVEKSCEKYKSYDPNVWSLEFFDPKTGGYVVVNRKRLAKARKSSNEREKYETEFGIAKVYARNGHAIEMLEENPNVCSYDVLIDGRPADIKNTSKPNNIYNYGKEAVRKQGAEIVLFQFEKMTPHVMKELNNLSKKGIHGMYIVKGHPEVNPF